jgi:hypothetical protein
MKKISAWLYKYSLSADPNDCYARVQTKAIVDNKEIARRIVRDGTEYQLETITNILDLADRYRCGALLDGHPVHSGFVNTQLGVKGNCKAWETTGNGFKLNVRCSPTQQLKKVLAAARLHIHGRATTGPDIYHVIDYHTQSRNQFITPAQVLLIEGKRLKIDGDPSVNGVFFINADKERFKAEQIINNEPRKLMVMIPPLSKDSTNWNYAHSLTLAVGH